MLHSKIVSADQAQTIQTGRTSLDRRIEELRNRPATYLNHGEALMLQGMATASLRQQKIVGNKIALDN
ncbi:MAG: hypothetical protein ACWA49_10060 [Ruegeria sp.]